MLIHLNKIDRLHEIAIVAAIEEYLDYANYPCGCDYEIVYGDYTRVECSRMQMGCHIMSLINLIKGF